jgi:hypothetical protein
MERRWPNRELSSPIEVKKSVITFMSLFVFVLVFLFKFSSKKNTIFFICYHAYISTSNDTKRFSWKDLPSWKCEIIFTTIHKNYEYVELDLLNIPRDLSTNLNEDSDNQKENVDFTFSRWQILPAEPLSVIARRYIRVEWNIQIWIFRNFWNFEIFVKILSFKFTDRTGKREFRKKTFFFSPNLHKISKFS